VSSLTSIFRRAWWASLAAIVVLSLVPDRNALKTRSGRLGSMSICSHISRQEHSALSLGEIAIRVAFLGLLV
jgi:hypothetical protein